MSHSQPLPPLYLPPPRCFTCGCVTPHLQLDFWTQLQNSADGAATDLPIRSIGDQKLVQRSVKTVEGNILDAQGVIRYCCRRMILSQPKEESKVPLPGLIGKGAFAAKDSEPEEPISPKEPKKVAEDIEEELDDEPEPEDVEGETTEEEEEETEDEAQEEIEQANT